MIPGKDERVMIRLGVCAEPKSETISIVEQAGFDYMECAFSWLHALSEEEYQALLARMKHSRIQVEASNGMLPGEVRVVGPEADENVIRAYLEKAFCRGHELGVKTVVFGSGAARRVPDGFDQAEAWRQIARYLTIANEYGEKYDIDIAIEPLRRAECNIMNLVTEGTLMSALLNLPRVGVLGDIHHMNCGAEPLSALTQAGKLLKHIHVSCTLGNEGGRYWPAPGDGYDYSELFRVLRESGYEGRVSIEAGCRNSMREDAPGAFEVLNAARSGK